MLAASPPPMPGGGAASTHAMELRSKRKLPRDAILSPSKFLSPTVTAATPHTPSPRGRIPFSLGSVGATPAHTGATPALAVTSFRSPPPGSPTGLHNYVSLGGASPAVPRRPTPPPGGPLLLDFDLVLEIPNSHASAITSSASTTLDGSTYSITCGAEKMDRENPGLKTWLVNTNAHPIMTYGDPKPREGHSTTINCCALSPDGKYLISGGNEPHFRLRQPNRPDWKRAMGINDTEVVLMMDGHFVQSCCFSPVPGQASTQLIIGTKNPNPHEKISYLKLYTITTNMFGLMSCTLQPKVIRVEANAVSNCYLLPTGEILYSSEKLIHIFNPISGAGRVRGFDEHQIIFCAYHYKNNKLFITVELDDGRVAIVDLEVAQPQYFPYDEKPAQTLCRIFSPDGNFIIWGMSNGQIIIQNIRNKEGRVITTNQSHAHPVTSLAISTDNKYMVSGDANGTVKFWLIR